MKEYIDKTALMKTVHTGMNIIEVMQAIIDEPAADVVEVRHGEWEIYQAIGSFALNGDFNVLSWRCSVCGGISTLYLKFCPNCGAKMDGGVNDAAD